jgi:hypothetical protein
VIKKGVGNQCGVPLAHQEVCAVYRGGHKGVPL